MKTLMTLEMKKNNVKPYLLGALGITIAMFGFLYLFAGVEEEELSTYADVIMIVTILNMASYCILSAVMFSRFVIEEYKGKRAILLFSYPVNRVKVLFAKVLLVCGFVFIFSLISNFIVFGFFNITEYFLPLVHEGELHQTIVNSILLIIIESFLAIAISLIAMAIGIWKESVPATIITAVVICSMISNLGTSPLLLLIGTCFILLIALIALGFAVKKVEHIEV